MTEESIIRFLIGLGIPRDEIYPRDEWVNCGCPLAPWTHAGGADSRPSFGVRINDEGLSYWYCFGCSPKGKTLSKLIHQLFVVTGRYPWTSAQTFAEDEIHYHSDEALTKLKPRDHWKLPEETVREVQPLPPEVIRQYPLLQNAKGFEARRCREFLQEERLIIPTFAYQLGVRYDPDNRCLIFPLTDIKGRIFMLRSRSRVEKAIWTINPKKAGYPNLVFPRLREVGVWFGMHLIDWRRPVMAIEAELDVARLHTLGYFNVIASATSSVTDAQIDSLCMARTIILGYDADRAGSNTHKRIIERVNKRSTIFEVDWSVGRKHPRFRKNKTDGCCKDAGDLLDDAELRRVLDKRRNV